MNLEKISELREGSADREQFRKQFKGMSASKVNLL
jgi:hypothetical protein